MKTNKSAEIPEQNISEGSQNKGQSTSKTVAPNKDKKTKKKHSSAIVAASAGRSAVSNAGAHAYRDGGFAQSGTNLSYREEDGVL